MEKLTEPQLMELQEQYVLATYAPDMTLVRGAMSWVWDAAGRRYLDFCTGISVCNLGHCHPRVTEAIQRQAATLVHVSNLFFNETQPQLAAQIAKHSFGGRVFFCNSGAEANEGLIKFARRWGSETGRHEILCMEESFHGRTLATLAATGRGKYRVGFAPDTPGFAFAPFNDLAAVRDAVTGSTAAILVEPVQGEGGIIPATPEFLTGLRDLCNERDLLLLFDEVQCGMGRTGRSFAHQHYGVEPDGMSMAKALGNGLPLGAFELQQKYADALPPGTHASTFGGTPLACAAGLAVFEAMDEENVLHNVEKMGAHFREKLCALKAKYSCIKEIRGRGLMIGVELTTPVKDLLSAARDKGLIALSAGENVLRMLPPLTVQAEEIDFAADVLDEAMSSL